MPKDPNEMVKCELKRIELDLLCDWYDAAIAEVAHCKVPLNVAQREEFKLRCAELAKMHDGRWTNRGPGRRRKGADAPTEQPQPALPIETNPAHEPLLVKPF